MIKANVVVDDKIWYRKIKSPEKYLSKRLKKIKKFISPTQKKITFTILLTKSSKMRQLNKQFRCKNKATDVLSFPFLSKKNFLRIKEKNLYVGDIAVSYEIINKRSLGKKNFLDEFNKVWSHGFLHLLGYDHIKSKDFKKMNKIEKKIWKII